MGRQQARHQNILEVEALNLMPCQGCHRESPGAAAEQIHVPSPEFPRAGARQQEGDATILDQPVHLVEEFGNHLDLVDHHPGARVREPFAQQSGPRRIFRKDVRHE